MLRGLYTAAAGMINQQRRHDTITNNIANLQTPGYKQNQTVSRSFPEMLIALSSKETEGQRRQRIGRLNTGVLAEETVLLFRQGDLMETGNPLDMAIVSNILTDEEGQPYPPFDATGKYVTPEGERIYQPQAFFTVRNEAGEIRYTRAGQFRLGEEGQLVTANGLPVLGSNGEPIVLRDPVTDEPLAAVQITTDGRILDASGNPLYDEAGNPLALYITRINNPNRLLSEGSGLYRLDEADADLAVQAVLGDEIQIRQGYVERSNVDATQSVVDMMNALRIYEANQKMVQYYDQSLSKAVNEVGKV